MNVCPVKWRSVLPRLKQGAALLVAAQLLAGPASFAQNVSNNDAKTQSPIKHVIIIVGENRTFDHVFATYESKHGYHVDNLLSKGIIHKDGTPGSNFAQAEQFSANTTNDLQYQISPYKKSLYPVLPAPLTGGPSNVCTDNGICTLADATSSENGLPASYYPFLLSGGTGLASHVPDSRITGVFNSAPYSTLAPGPFQLTNGKTFTNDSYAASPVHRFYQMWQQTDCNVKFSTPFNPSGCKSDLFTWTEVTVGSNNNGKPQPPNFSTDYSPTAATTGEGATAMGFYNVAQGDSPYLNFLADHYVLSDNYHQPVMGGTGANSIMLGFADSIFFTDGKGNPARPPHNEMVWADQPADAGVVDEIENPNTQPHTNNFWIQDGYGGGGFGHPVSGGGSYTNCSDSDAPGANAILTYLSSLPYEVNPKCDPNHYYLLNNYNPGYFGDGSNAFTDHFIYNTPFTIPGTSQHSIADVLMDNHVSWKYYGDQWNSYLGDKYQLNYGKVGTSSDQYCNICNPFQYQTQIMTNDAVRTAHLKDTTDLYADIAAGTLPAVSYVKPSGWVDGHPASSKLDLFEGFVKKIVDQVQSNKELWASTAIFVTVDEGGGYYDSGYIQPLDYFGDGTRIPLLIVSPYTSGGKVAHEYSDHVSIIKFIERNWNLGTISKRSRDNLPNPKHTLGNPYVPTNSPAIGDLFSLFHFDTVDPDHDGDTD